MHNFCLNAKTLLYSLLFSGSFLMFFGQSTKPTILKKNYKGAPVLNREGAPVLNREGALVF